MSHPVHQWFTAFLANYPFWCIWKPNYPKNCQKIDQKPIQKNLLWKSVKKSFKKNLSDNHEKNMSKNLSKKSIEKSVNESVKNPSKNPSKKSVQKNCQKICPKNLSKNLSKSPSKKSDKKWLEYKKLTKICLWKNVKNLSKFMNLLKIISDYPFLIHKLPQKSNLPQVKKHCCTLFYYTVLPIFAILKILVLGQI